MLPVAYLTVRATPAAWPGAANAVIVGEVRPPRPGVVALALAFWTLQAPGPWPPLPDRGPAGVRLRRPLSAPRPREPPRWPWPASPPGLDDAARTLGAGRLRRLRTVDLPLATPGLLAGAGLVLLSTMKELPATLLWPHPGSRPWPRASGTPPRTPILADASLAALFLLALSGVLTWFLVVRRGNAPT